MAEYIANRERDRVALFAPKGSMSNAFSNYGKATETLSNKFVRLERLSKREINKYWEKVSLDNYIEHNMIPRGLRILIFPDFTHNDDQDLAQEWEENLTLSSEKMLKLLVIHAEREHTRITTQIDALQKEIAEMANPNTVKDKNYDKMHALLKDYQDEVKIRKFRKFYRDERDYNNDRVYTFQAKFDQDNIKSVIATPTTTPVSSEIESEEDQPSATDKGEESFTPALTHQRRGFLAEIKRYKKGNIPSQTALSNKTVRFTVPLGRPTITPATSSEEEEEQGPDKGRNANKRHTRSSSKNLPTKSILRT
ncbi:uncharacterized protein [Ambystoma mexicanum]|uniref:uncharacterized protein isoform X2 n=1 Tax=Ambystoma mexicanum TaxID=8296 RepID=UPI0037E766BF